MPRSSGCTPRSTAKPRSSAPPEEPTLTAGADFDSVAFTDVGRTFGRRRALHRVTFAAHAGEIVALLGPNGAGKSTFLAIAATLMQPSSGEVRYGSDTASSGGAALRARIGLLGHDLYLYPELSAAENLAFFANLYGLHDVGRVVTGSLDRANLADRRDDPVGSFSRGMRQRLAVERALIHAPRLVLLDEPFTGLDDASATVLKGRLAAERARGAIVIITTHDLEAIEGVVDRAVALRSGRLTPLDDGGGSLRDRYRRAATVR